MKLIMENWRKFINEWGAHGHYGDKFMGRKIDQEKTGKAQQAMADKVSEANSTDIRFLISLVDPTQISAYPDIPPAIKAWEDNPSWANSALLVLALLAVIPIVGKAAKGISKFSKSLKSVKGGEKVSKKILSSVENLSKTKKLVYNELEVFAKHIKDNIPIPKNIALDIIKKAPGAAVKGKPVYRGMTVSKEYILKNYGQEILSKGPGVHVIDIKKSFTPRKGTGTSSWSLDPSESTLWSGGVLNKKSFNPETDVKLLIVGGGPNDVGLNITKRADEIGSKYTHFDQAEVSMIGNVEIQRVVITVGTSPKGKGFLSDSFAANKKMKPGFYPAADRPEMMNLLKSSGVL